MVMSAASKSPSSTCPIPLASSGSVTWAEGTPWAESRDGGPASARINSADSTRRMDHLRQAAGDYRVPRGVASGGESRLRYADDRLRRRRSMNARDLDTPAVYVDLDALERNIERMQRQSRSWGVKLRPHTKTQTTPEI